MKTRLTMQMPEGLESREVEITGVVVLPEDEIQNLLATGQLPERYLERLNKYTKTVTQPRSILISNYKALLVLSEIDEHGVAVCGKNHVSYASVFPSAREWLDRRIAKMANFICEFSHVPEAKLPHNLKLSRVGGIFACTVTADNGIGEQLFRELKKRNEIAEIVMHEDYFEINYNLTNAHESSISNIEEESPGMTIL